jgi:phenylalanine-4-hydroxylase
MGKSTQYVAHQPDDHGQIVWPNGENSIWKTLVERQSPILERCACQAYIDGTQALGLPTDYIPQLTDIDRVLNEATGWETKAVPALINFSTFFKLLSERKFPVATFIRTAEDMDYLQEPDIFHEIFGHCPLLTNEAFAKFTETYGKLGLAASKEDRVYLARLYWFTVEFGLIQSTDGSRSLYGGGILSSPKETLYAFESEEAERTPFDLVTVLRTPYRIDILQPQYFYLDSVDQLFDIAKLDIMSAVKDAKKLGLLEPKFPQKIVVNQ